MKLYMRFHDTKSVPLKSMQEKADKEFGLCCYRYNGDIDTEFMEMTVEEGEEGEVIIFEGEIWGLCPEGPKVYPIKIHERIQVKCERKGKYKEFVVI